MRAAAALALCGLIAGAAASGQPQATGTAPPAESAAPKSLRAHGYPVDGLLLSNPNSGYEAIVHSWESSNPRAPRDMRQVSYRMCNVRKNAPLYFQWPLAGFNTGSAGLLPENWCAELDRLSVGTVELSPQATIDFTKQLLPAPYPTVYIKPPGLLGRFQAHVLLHEPGSMRTDWSRGQRSFQMSTERKEQDNSAMNDIEWNSELVVYLALPRSPDPQALRGPKAPTVSPGAKAEVLAPSQAIVDFASTSSVQAFFAERSVLRLTPSDKGTSRAHYDLQLSGKQVERLPMLLRKKGSREIFMLLGYDTPAP